MIDIDPRIMAMVEKMPAFPASVTTILNLTARSTCAPKDLVEVIEHDPVLTVKVLKLVNSAYFGLSREVTSVKQAIVYVGINTIKNVAISIAAMGALPSTSPSGYDLQRFLSHSLTTAAAARVLARGLGVKENDLGDFFVASLLHDIGQLLMAQFFPAEFAKALSLCADDGVSIQQAEQQMMGVDHAMVGAMLAERWQLPAPLVGCIRNHHRLGEIESPTPLDMTVFVANQVSKMVVADGQGLSQIESFPPHVETWVGGDLHGVMGRLHDLDTEIERCRHIIAA